MAQPSGPRFEEALFHKESANHINHIRNVGSGLPSVELENWPHFRYCVGVPFNSQCKRIVPSRTDNELSRFTLPEKADRFLICISPFGRQYKYSIF